jgi:uncharacterized protein (UPF0332 family)
MHDLYLRRAQNELNLSLIILKISDNKDLQISTFGMKQDTYYSAAISHAYFSIFYAAKAYLMLKGIKTEAPEEHRKTFDAFSKLVETGVIDVELLKIYREMFVKADALLQIFEREKGKRGKFTYRRISQANREPATESVNNAKFFYKNMFELCEKIKSRQL